MSDLFILLTEGDKDALEFLRNEIRVQVGESIIMRNLALGEGIDTRFRLDQNVKVLAQHHLPSQTFLYANN